MYRRFQNLSIGGQQDGGQERLPGELVYSGLTRGGWGGVEKGQEDQSGYRWWKGGGRRKGLRKGGWGIIKGTEMDGTKRSGGIPDFT